MSESQKQSLLLKSAILEQVNTGLLAVNSLMEVVIWNHFMEVNSGKPADEVIGLNLFDCFPALPKKWLSRKINNVFVLGNFSFTSWEQRPYLFNFPVTHSLQSDVDCMLQDTYFYPIKSPNDEVNLVAISILDVTQTGIYQNRLAKTVLEQQGLIKQLEEAQNQLQQSEKMAAIGQLSAGVAHEINNPVAFVASNLNTLNDYVASVFKVVACYESVESNTEINETELAKIQQIKDEVDYAFLIDDVVSLLSESSDGLKRVKQIVQDLKDFSRPDSGDWGWSDLRQGIDSTLNVIANEIKYKAEVIKEYGDVPDIFCIIAQLNQVFMNLIINAAHAIEDHGIITIRTSAAHNGVILK